MGPLARGQRCNFVRRRFLTGYLGTPPAWDTRAEAGALGPGAGPPAAARV